MVDGKGFPVYSRILKGNHYGTGNPDQRATIIMIAQDGTICNLRITDNPEKRHHEIYQIFGIVDRIKRRKTSVNESR